MIYQGNVTGSDDGATYSAVMIPRFDTFNVPEEKQALSCRINAIERTPVSYQAFCNSDWQVEIPSPLQADPDVATNLWGTAVWGQFQWGANGQQQRVSEWRTVYGNGYSLAPGLQITSGRLTAPDVQIISLDLLFEIGRITG